MRGADGVVRRRIREGCRRRLLTLFGEVEVRRCGYSAPEEGSPFPLDGRVNLPKDPLAQYPRAIAVPPHPITAPAYTGGGRSQSCFVIVRSRPTEGMVGRRCLTMFKEDCDRHHPCRGRQRCHRHGGQHRTQPNNPCATRSRCSRRRINRSCPGRWTIGPAISASGPRRRRGPPSRWDGTGAYGDTAASSRRSRRASESPVLRPRDPPPEVRGAPGPVTSESRSCAYTKGALQRLSFVVVFAPVPVGRFRGGRAFGRVGHVVHGPCPTETDRGVLYHARSRIALFDPLTLTLSWRERRS
jgi:hypothetical protein